MIQRRQSKAILRLLPKNKLPRRARGAPKEIKIEISINKIDTHSETSLGT